MRLRARPPSPPREPVIPLINVAFIVLVFMMLGTIIEPVQVLPVELPFSTVDATPERAAVVTMDAAGRLGLDGRLVERAALLAELAEAGPGRVVLRVDAASKAQHVVELAEAIRATGVAAVELATRRR